MKSITGISAREILDSRGHPTIEVDVRLEDGSLGRASVPAGASCGTHEALAHRDGGERYGGDGVKEVVSRVNREVANLVLGFCALDQAAVDQALIRADGTENKSRLGANAILGVSLAVAKAAAQSLNIPVYRYIGGACRRILPVPMMNILNGGVHADNAIDIQEFMIVPVGMTSFREALRAGAEIFHALKQMLKARGYSTNVGDEGGFAPEIRSAKEALDFMVCSIEKAGYEPGKDVFIALDIAATELCEGSQYVLKGEDRTFNSLEMVDYLDDLVGRYPIISIEDGMAEDDWDGWHYLTERLGMKCQIVGDDVFATNLRRLSAGITKGVANAIIIKVNQIGTLSEALEVVHRAHRSSYRTIISHRSGETEDSVISDLAVAVGSYQAKMGAPSRTDRVAKYNQLLRIEEDLGDSAVYAGDFAFEPGHRRSLSCGEVKRTY